MRHLKKGKKFHLIAPRRRSFLRILANNLILRERIETTEARAKALRPLTEKMVTLAKKQNLAARRLAISRIHDKAIVKKLFDDIAPRYKDRQGGYLRIKKSVKWRKRDGSKMATIEFVPHP